MIYHRCACIEPSCSRSFEEGVYPLYTPLWTPMPINTIRSSKWIQIKKNASTKYLLSSENDQIFVKHWSSYINIVFWSCLFCITIHYFGLKWIHQLHSFYIFVCFHSVIFLCATQKMKRICCKLLKIINHTWIQVLYFNICNTKLKCLCLYLGHVDVAKNLISKGAIVDTADSNGRTTLYYAAANAL